MSNNFKISVIIPVYNALEDVKLCLESLLKNFNFELGDICLINDCSNEETTEFLNIFAKIHENIKILNNKENLGFVKTCNRGMQLAQGDIVVLLNSDTQIPAEFCERIIKCFKSNDNIGIASPISSCSCTFYIEMPQNYTIEKMNKLLREKHQCVYPTIHAAEGYCFCIRKSVINQQGYLDEIYGKGYHEEVDYAYRAITNGWKNVLIDDLYVYHKRQASFGAETREKLIQQNNPIFKERWEGFREYYTQKNRIKNPIHKIKKQMFPLRYDPNSCERKGIEYLFSLKNSNDKKHKIITLSGLKIKIKNKFINKNIKKKKFFHYRYSFTPRVLVNKNKPTSINIFIPGINKSSLTAGPLGILYFAKYLIDKGHNVVLYAMAEKFEPQILKDIIGLDVLLDKATIIKFYGSKYTKTISISPNDICVATLWNTAYLAKYIQNYCNNKKFIYIIQDYETIFYPNSSTAALIENTYSFNYFPVFSTSVLKDFFYMNNIGQIKNRDMDYAVFNTASNAHLPELDTMKKRKEKKKLVFYGRPHRPRNCYELGIMAIEQAINMNILNPDEWEFYSIGAKENEIFLANNVTIKALPYINVEEYKKNLSHYDLGISLMMSPHPSMVPIDLALSGVPVITNTYKNKDYDYLKSISKNIYPCDLNIDSIVETICNIAYKSDNLEERYQNAIESKYPNNWGNSFVNMKELDKFILYKNITVGV